MSNKLSRTLTFSTLMKMRCFRSTGVKLLVADQHLRLTQNEKAAFIERESEPGFWLGFGIEIHQGVAAHQQVNPGDGRISNEVMTTKDRAAASPEVGRAVRAFKVTL